MPAPAEPPHPSPEGVSCGRAPEGQAAVRNGHWRDNRRLTAGLLLPYLLWVGFASLLNLAIVILN